MVFKERDSSSRLSTACWLDVTRRADGVTLTLHGEFDLACEERFRAELGLHMDDAVSRLTLDLRELTFMDSSGLAMLLALDAIARSDDFEFWVLCAGDGAVRTLLRQTGLDGVLPVMDPFGPVPATDSPV
jgi:anti-anti-sigma factor